jgi:hypothetical protein
MALLLNPSNFGSWELTYSRKLVGDTNQPRGVRVPYIDPVEIPYIPTSRIFLVGTFLRDAKPTWYRAGYLTQEIRNVQISDSVVFEGLPGTPDTTVDGSTQIIGLNRVQMVIFPKYSSNFSLRFEAVAWLKSLILTIWEYKGTETDSTEELIEATRAKLEAIEFKIDNLGV